MARSAVLIAGLASNSGKTLIALGLMRQCVKRGVSVAGAKAGPDYIDPQFHRYALGNASGIGNASGKASVNLDPFAMPPAMLRSLAASQQGEVLIIEGAMGVHDGGEASSARLAQILGVPIILVMDIRGQAETAASVALGIKASLDKEGAVLAGVILNRCRSARHANLVTHALKAHAITVFGAIPEDKNITIPSRHLGLVQADDLPEIEPILARASALCADLDIAAIIQSAGPLTPKIALDHKAQIPPPAARIAVALDRAFGFCYEHILQGWRQSGAEVMPFSPLADEAPCPDAGFVFLPGGYPELHLKTLAGARQFQEGMRRLASQNTPIYGECGGYMVLGEGIISSQGECFPMLGLLQLETSFTAPKRHLGYRKLHRIAPAPLPQKLLGHEFHYTQATRQIGKPLFEASDKDGTALGQVGLIKGSVFGSYMHIIAAAI